MDQAMQNKNYVTFLINFVFSVRKLEKLTMDYINTSEKERNKKNSLQNTGQGYMELYLYDKPYHQLCNNTNLFEHIRHWR